MHGPLGSRHVLLPSSNTRNIPAGNFGLSNLQSIPQRRIAIAVRSLPRTIRVSPQRHRILYMAFLCSFMPMYSTTSTMPNLCPTKSILLAGTGHCPASRLTKPVSASGRQSIAVIRFNGEPAYGGIPCSRANFSQAAHQFKIEAALSPLAYEILPSSDLMVIFILIKHAWNQFLVDACVCASQSCCHHFALGNNQFWCYP